MAYLTPDKTTTVNGVTVKEFLLTEHNPNKIAFDPAKITDLIGVTIHNTGWISVSSKTTPAEQYTRATYNGNMGTTRVHYYVDDVCAWQNLPLDQSGWHAADGDGDGNRKTIAVECIMSSAYNSRDKQSEDNAARLVAHLLFTNGFTIQQLYTHTHWLNVRDGKKGTVDELNVMKHPYKMCPTYILKHWDAFKLKVSQYLDKLNGKKPTDLLDELYRIRKSWDKPETQIGAFSNKDNAIAACKPGYTVYDSKGNAIYSCPTKHSVEPYLIRVKAGSLNIRKTPKWGNGDIVGSLKGGSTLYTIVEETMLGTSRFGKLKSGIGWISLSDKYVEIKK